MGFDGFPGFVALNLGSVGQALALNALEDGRGALNIVDAEGDPKPNKVSKRTSPIDANRTIGMTELIVQL